MAGIEFEITKEIAVLAEKSGGWTKEFNLVNWNNRGPKYDIREWDPEHEKMGKGVTLTVDEAKKLYVALKKEFDGDDIPMPKFNSGDLSEQILKMAKD